MPARHIYLLVPARHVPARHIYLLVPARHCARSALGVEPHAHVMRKDVQHATPCEKTCKNHAKSCHAKSCQNHAKNKLFHMLQKTSCSTCHAKTMQKPCKNYATCGAYAGVYTGQVARQGGYAGRRGNPLNIHSPQVPCYMCHVLYLTRQATEHPLSRVPCYVLSHKASH